MVQHLYEQSLEAAFNGNMGEAIVNLTVARGDTNSPAPEGHDAKGREARYISNLVEIKKELDAVEARLDSPMNNLLSPRVEAQKRRLIRIRPKERAAVSRGNMERLQNLGATRMQLIRRVAILAARTQTAELQHEGKRFRGPLVMDIMDSRKGLPPARLTPR